MKLQEDASYDVTGVNHDVTETLRRSPTDTQVLYI